MSQTSWRAAGLAALVISGAACSAGSEQTSPNAVVSVGKLPDTATHARKIAPRGPNEPEPVVLLQRPYRPHPTLFPLRRLVGLVPKSADESWVVSQTLFRGSFDVGWLLTDKAVPDTVGVFSQGKLTRLGPFLDALAAPSGKWLLARTDKDTQLLTMPGGQPIGPVVLPWADETPIEFLTDEYVGGKEVLSIAERKLRPMIRREIGYTDALANIGVASTIEGSEANVQFYVEAFDFGAGKRIHEAKYTIDGRTDPTPPVVKITPDKRAYAAATEGEIRRVDMKTGRMTVVGTPLGQGAALDLALSDDGVWVCAQWNHEVSGFRFDPAAQVVPLPRDHNEAFGIEGGQCHRRVIPASDGFRPSKGSVNNGRTGSAGAIAISPDRRSFAVLENTQVAKNGRFAAGDFRVSVFQASDGAKTGAFPIALKRPAEHLGIEFDPDSGHLVVHGSAVGEYGVLDLASGKWLLPVDDHRLKIDRLAPAGRTPLLLEAARLPSAQPTERWTFEKSTLRGPGGATILTPEPIFAVREGPTGVVVAVHERSLTLYRPDGTLLADVIAAGDGAAIALMKGGAVDVRGDQADAPLRCREGDVLSSWSTCRDRFLVPGALDRALAGKEDWLETK